MEAPSEHPGQAESASEPVALHPHSCVAANTLCKRCGYNLRTLTAEGRCPECGLEVAATLAQRYLRDADAGWLRRLSVGSALVLLGVTLAPVGLVAIAGAGIVRVSEPALVMFGLLLLAGPLAGLYLLSMPDPPARTPTTRSVALRAVWWLCAVMLMLVFGQALLAAPDAAWIRYAGGCLSLAAAITTLLRLDELMMRVPAPELARVARLAAVALGIGAALMTLAGLPAVALSGPAAVVNSAWSSMVAMIGGLFLVPGLLAMLVVFLAANYQIVQAAGHATVREKAGYGVAEQRPEG